MTILSKRVVRWLLDLDRTIVVVCVQEHRLRGAEFYAAKRQLHRQYHVIGKPAVIKLQAPSGGALVLVRRSQTLVSSSTVSFAEVCKSANAAVASIRMKNVTISAISMYIPPHNDRSVEVMQYVSHVWNRLGNPRLVCADFNMTPEELIDMKWTPAMAGSIHTPDCPYTCSAGKGRIIDYGVGDISMKHMILATRPVYDVPCKPHIGVVHWISQKPRLIKVYQLVKPKKIPYIADLDNPARLEPFSMQKALELARDWTSLNKQVHKIDQQLWGYLEGLDDTRSSWSLGVEYGSISMAQEIRRASTATHDHKELKKITGRGQVPHFRWGRLIPKKCPEHMEFSDIYGFLILARNLFRVIHKHRVMLEHPEYLRLYSVRPKFYDGKQRFVDCVHSQLHSMVAPGPDESQVDPPKLKEIEYKCHWCHRLSRVALKKVIEKIERYLKEVEANLDKKDRAGFADFVNTSLERPGAGPAHRFTAGRAKAPPLPTVVEIDGRKVRNFDEQMAYYKHMWESHWGRHKEDYPKLILAIKEATAAAKECPPLTSQQRISSGGLG